MVVSSLELWYLGYLYLGILSRNFYLSFDAFIIKLDISFSDFGENVKMVMFSKITSVTFEYCHSQSLTLGRVQLRICQIIIDPHLFISHGRAKKVTSFNGGATSKHVWGHDSSALCRSRRTESGNHGKPTS